MSQAMVRRSGLTKIETRVALRSFNLNTALRSVFNQICTGTGLLITAFAIALGVAKEHMGVLGSVVSAACLLQLAGVALSSRVRDKKRAVLFLAAAEPAILVICALSLPFLPEPLRLPVLGLMVFTVAAFMHMNLPVTEEWLASTIPAPLRGRYLGHRLRLLGIAVLATTLLLAMFGEQLSRSLGALGLACILGLGGLFGLASVLPLSKAKLPALSAASRVSMRDLGGVFRERPFRRFLAAVLVYQAPFCFAVPFYYVYFMEELGMSMTLAALLPLGYQLIRIAVLGYVGRLVDRLGGRRVFLLIGPIYAVFFTMMGLSQPGQVWMVFAAWTVVGLGDAAYNVAYYAQLYNAVPVSNGRQAYFAVCNLLILGAYSVAAAMSVGILHLLKDVSLQLGPWTLGQFQVFFLGCGGAMLLCTLGANLMVDTTPSRGKSPARESVEGEGDQRHAVHRGVSGSPVVPAGRHRDAARFVERGQVQPAHRARGRAGGAGGTGGTAGRSQRTRA